MEKSRNGFPEPPGPGGQKSQKRLELDFKMSKKKQTFSRLFNSFLTLFCFFCLPPRPGRPREPISRLFFRTFSHSVFGLNCPSAWSKGSQGKLPRTSPATAQDPLLRLESDKKHPKKSNTKIFIGGVLGSE